MTEKWWRSAAFAPALVALAAAGALGLVQWIALRTVRGQEIDENVTRTAVAATGSRVVQLAELIGDASFILALAGCAVVVGVALWRFGVPYAVGAAILIGGANLTTQALKHVLLVRTETAVVASNSLPSGHTTVVAAFVLAGLLVVPAQGRPLAAKAGMAWIAVMGTATVLSGWHRLSDVVAAVLVCLAWAGAVAALLAGRGASRHPGIIGPWLLVAAAGGLGTAIVAAWALSRPDSAGLGGYGVVAALVSVGTTTLTAVLVVEVWSRLVAALASSHPPASARRAGLPQSSGSDRA